jgi:hypothetical protein
MSTTRSDRTARWVTDHLHRRRDCLPRTCEKSHRIWVQHRGLATTTTPFDMVVLNERDRFHLVADVIVACRVWARELRTRASSYATSRSSTESPCGSMGRICRKFAAGGGVSERPKSARETGARADGELSCERGESRRRPQPLSIACKGCKQKRRRSWLAAWKGKPGAPHKGAAGSPGGSSHEWR